MQIVGQAKQVCDANNEMTGGFMGLALSIDSQYFSEIPIRGETLILKLDSDFNVESVENVSAYSLASDMIGKSIFSSVHPVDLDHVWAHLQERKIQKLLSRTIYFT
jgi:hypothetical protein